MLTTVGKLALADAGFAGLTLPRVGLFVNDFSPDEDSEYADFTLPTYTGYANFTPTPSSVFVQQDGKVTVDYGEAAFIGPTAGAGEDVYGWFLFDNVTHDVWACGRFDPTPLSLNALLDRVAADLDLHLEGTDTVGQEN